MAGLFGFFLRQSRPRQWVGDRIDRLAAGMSRRAYHRSFRDLRGSLAIGGSGPSLLRGNLEPHPGHDGCVLYMEGETYHSRDTLGEPRPGDTLWEQIRRRWKDKGAEALSELDGLYNLVLYEPRSPEGERLSILNDRYGSRRLYYMERPEAFVFASELKALLAWPDVDWSVDHEFVVETVCLGSVLGNKTWFREASLLPPATVLVETKDLRSRRYWSWSSLPPPGTHAGAKRLEQLHHLWQCAITTRLSPEPMGQQLSGGLDSRLILAEAGSRRPDWITSTYGEPGSDEVRFALRCAEVAGRPWIFWHLPGPDWLARRVELMLETDGMVDLVSLHHAGLVEPLGRLIRFEMSGYLGDLVLGDTFYACRTPLDVLGAIAYWDSPVSLDLEVVLGRVESCLSQHYAPLWSVVDEKCRRATNGWPHLAVNDLEVRKPFMDYRFLEFCAGLTPSDRSGHSLYRELLARYYSAYARVPYQKTGVSPVAAKWKHIALRSYRVGYRAARRLTARVGMPIRPWVRGAVDVARWLHDPEVRSEVRSTLIAPDAYITSHFDRQAIADTLRLALEASEVPVEVVLNLYRVEKYLRHVRDIVAPAGSGR